MLPQLTVLVRNNLRAILRDRILYAVFGVAFAMILLVPSLSGFSMRQVQELAITLSLSISSWTMLVVTLLLGASSVWRDVDRRYTATILTLPFDRGVFLLGKFIGIALFLAICALALGLGSALVVTLAAATYPSDLPVHWGNLALVLVGDVVKYLLLTAFALLLSTVSTSFYLPFFGTAVICFCGGASQEVFEYVSGQFGHGMNPLAVKAVTFAYYLIPNLSAFDYQLQAVYALPIPLSGLCLSTLYAVIYIAILLGLAIFAFNRRELS